MTTISTLLAAAGRRTLGAALGLGLASSVLAPGAAQAEPAMWVVKDADSTIYLFGTVHLLKDKTAWRTPKVDAALKASSELWLELAETGDDAASAAAMTKLIPTLGLDPARPLSTKLTAADRAKLETAAKKLGTTAAALEPMRPWLVSLTFSLLPLQQAGYDPKLGVDGLLAAAARAEKKPIRAFESVEQQLRFFADLPPAIELQMLRETLDEVDKSPKTLDQLSAAWAAGDGPAFERLFLDELRDDAPEFYKVFIVNRNEAWAKAIVERLKGSGTSFVAVGAGHLVGPDSVQAKLRAKGVTATRR